MIPQQAVGIMAEVLADHPECFDWGVMTYNAVLDNYWVSMILSVAEILLIAYIILTVIVCSCLLHVVLVAYFVYHSIME